MNFCGSSGPANEFSRGYAASGFVFGVRLSIGLLLSGCLSGLLSSPAAWGDEASRQRVFDQELVPLLRTYCYDCHGADAGEGDVLLAADATPDAILNNRRMWVRALGQVRLGAMPPADAESMPEEIRLRLASLIDDLANAVDCVKNPNAGKVVMRRLNRFEYRNTVRDLLGVDYEAAINFPGDDVGYGFDNVGDVLSLPPLLMEKYLLAADEISRQAIKTPPPADLYLKTLAASQLKGAEKFNAARGGLGIHSRGFVDFAPDLPFPGNYTLTITAYGDQGGDEPVKMEVRLNGDSLAIIDVPNSDPEEFTVQFRTRLGKHQLEIGFINDFWEPETKTDRNLHLVHTELSGQDNRVRYIPSTELPASHRQIIFATPSAQLSADRASRLVLERLMSRAYRRPAHKREVDRLCELAAAVRSGGGSFDESIQVALQAILVSPHFLFKVERHQPLGPNGEPRLLTDFELATRLSYFLWSSMPDDRLLKAAWQGQLSKPDVLRGEVARMIKDGRSNALITNFAGQWLQLRSLETTQPDEGKFPQFTPQLRQAMQRETLTFFAGVLRGNLPVTTLLEGDFTYLNQPLAEFYGIPGVEGEQFRKVSLRGTPRAGLLTHASVLTVTSNPTRTSPVKRGKWILENLLNMPPPPPPPDVPELEQDALSGTLRERMEQHRANPACAACHNMMDPLGFALENFDAIGRWRTSDGEELIDASGQLPDGTTFQGIEQLRSHLTGKQREQFVRCLTEKLMIYALGRGLEYYDKCAIDEILLDAKSKDYRFAYIIAGIVASPPFQNQGER
ncbi:DUF1592 domain-containing protein [Planctomycetaceae bacterium SH139]